VEAAHYKLDDFELYRLAREFRKKIYRVVRGLPPEEKYCLGTQMRRAALSVSNNIAEGHGRWHYQENMHFCRIARGSVDEVLDDLNTCLDEAYGEPNELAALKEEGYVLIRRVNGYIAYLRKSQQGKDG
jgi:four helix bundle protein